MTTFHYEKRLQNACELLQKDKVDALVVSEPVAITYFTGIRLDPGERLFALLIKKDGTCKLVINRLFDSTKSFLPMIWYSDEDDTTALLKPLLAECRTIGVDKFWPAKFLLSLIAAQPNTRFIIGSIYTDRLRAIKDKEEQNLMIEASKINDACMVKLAAWLREGVTEKAAADYLAGLYKAAGCEGLSFPSIVSFGPNGADPHHEPDDTALKPGDSIVIDIGCKKNGYCSDMTRTYFWGEPSEEQKRVHTIVKEANELAEQMVKPGVPLKELDQAARDHIAEAGYGPQFNHRLGHFIGQTDHEAGDVSSVSPIIAQPGMIFSIEPGIYIKGKFGVRIEDLVLVTETGCRILNSVPKGYRLKK